jgi:thioredoxin reductase
MMISTDVVVIGGGAAGLHAANEAAKWGAQVHLIDENHRPGGQLFKQIHKFFGSHRHYAGIRGLTIGQRLLQETAANGVHVLLDSYVFELASKAVGIVQDNVKFDWIQAKAIILCCGASEKMIMFPGWTLPGVMGAGAAQTLINVHRVLPGKKFLMVGSGNVGLVVAYQILQAGGEVVAILEALPHVGGWQVHAAKVQRLGVPLQLSHSILAASGNGRVQYATIAALDEHWQMLAGSQQQVDVDVICVAAGLKPNIEVPIMAGCETLFLTELGGRVPIHDANMETTQPGIYVAGDCAGVEEASTAIESGRLAGIAAAEKLGFVSRNDALDIKKQIHEVLQELRAGPFGVERVQAKQLLNQRAQALRNTTEAS